MQCQASEKLLYLFSHKDLMTIQSVYYAVLNDIGSKKVPEPSTL